MSHYVWIAPLVALALAQVAVIATSVYLHRGLAHRAIRLHPAVDVMLPGGPLDHDGAEPAGVGRRPPQAPRVHGPVGRPA